MCARVLVGLANQRFVGWEGAAWRPSSRRLTAYLHGPLSSCCSCLGESSFLAARSRPGQLGVGALPSRQDMILFIKPLGHLVNTRAYKGERIRLQSSVHEFGVSQDEKHGNKMSFIKKLDRGVSDRPCHPQGRRRRRTPFGSGARPTRLLMQHAFSRSLRNGRWARRGWARGGRDRAGPRDARVARGGPACGL